VGAQAVAALSGGFGNTGSEVSAGASTTFQEPFRASYLIEKVAP